MSAAPIPGFSTLGLENGLVQPTFRLGGHLSGGKAITRLAEAKGIDKSGKRFELYVHPVTGEIIARK